MSRVTPIKPDQLPEGTIPAGEQDMIVVLQENGDGKRKFKRLPPEAFKGNDAPQVRFQYSVDGVSDWVDVFNNTHIFLRTSVDDGNTWSDAMRFVGVPDDDPRLSDARPATHMKMRPITDDVFTWLDGAGIGMYWTQGVFQNNRPPGVYNWGYYIGHVHNKLHMTIEFVPFFYSDKKQYVHRENGVWGDWTTHASTHIVNQTHMDIGDDILTWLVGKKPGFYVCNAEAALTSNLPLPFGGFFVVGHIASDTVITLEATGLWGSGVQSKYIRTCELGTWGGWTEISDGDLDQESGTWTPTTETRGVSFNIARWQRVGNRVFFSALIETSVPISSLVVYGIPFIPNGFQAVQSSMNKTIVTGGFIWLWNNGKDLRVGNHSISGSYEI